MVSLPIPDDSVYILTKHDGDQYEPKVNTILLKIDTIDGIEKNTTNNFPMDWLSSGSTIITTAMALHPIQQQLYVCNDHGTMIYLYSKQSGALTRITTTSSSYYPCRS